MAKDSERGAAIRAAVKHFRELPRRSLTVPEWRGEDGAPLTLYWSPMTLGDRMTLKRAGEDEGLGMYARAIILKAEDADGNKLFSLEDKPELIRSVHDRVLTRIALAILGDFDVERAEGNSEPIPS